MTTEVIEAASIAAFGARYVGRPWVRFERQPEAVKHRWNVVTARVLTGRITTGRQFREAYLDGLYANPADMKMWGEIGQRERFSWQSVVDAANLAARAMGLLPFRARVADGQVAA